MGHYPEYEKTAQVYHQNVDLNTRKVTYPSVSFTDSLHIIKTSAKEVNISDEVITTHEANPNGDRTTGASAYKRGDKVVCNGRTFKLQNDPEYMPHVNMTKLQFIRFDSPTT